MNTLGMERARIIDFFEPIKDNRSISHRKFSSKY